VDIGNFIVLNILIEGFFITKVNKKFYFRVYISDVWFYKEERNKN